MNRPLRLRPSLLAAFCAAALLVAAPLLSQTNPITSMEEMHHCSRASETA